MVRLAEEPRAAAMAVQEPLAGEGILLYYCMKLTFWVWGYQSMQQFSERIYGWTTKFFLNKKLSGKHVYLVKPVGSLSSAAFYLS